MGDCFSSEYDHVPVQGLSQELAVIRGPDGSKYIDPAEVYTLKMREKMFSWTGDDASVKDLSGNKWFQIEGHALSFHEKCTMKDAQGNQIAGFRRRLMSMHATGHITVNVNGQTLAVATIKKESSFQMSANADIYIYATPQDVETVSTSGMSPTIKVDGSIMAKRYNFMYGNTKLAQVCRTWEGYVTSRDTYYVTVGFNVDIAFIIMCTLGLDEMFADQN